MDSLVSFLGGYNSWQFAAASLGCLFVGYVLYCFWLFLMPIPLVGMVLNLVYLNHYVDTLTSDVARQAGTAGIPVFAIGCLIAIFYPMSERLSPKKSDRKEDE